MVPAVANLYETSTLSYHPQNAAVSESTKNKGDDDDEEKVDMIDLATNQS